MVTLTPVEARAASLLSYDFFFFCYLCGVGCYFCFIFHSISWVLSHFFLVSLSKGLSILFLKRKKKQPSFMGLPYCFLGIYFIYFFSDVYDFLPSSGFGFCLFFFSLIPSGGRWSYLRFLLRKVCIAINLPLKTAFTAFHKLWEVVSNFICCKVFFYSSLISFIDQLVECCLVCMSLYFPHFPFCSWFSFILWKSAWYNFYLFKVVVTYFVAYYVTYPAEHSRSTAWINVYSACFRCNVLQISTKFNWSIVSLNTTVALLIFCLDDLFHWCKRGVKFPY